MVFFYFDQYSGLRHAAAAVVNLEAVCRLGFWIQSYDRELQLQRCKNLQLHK
jgi:hypothetical protein